jgi:hypothetical protein
MSAAKYTIAPVCVGILTIDHASLVWGQQYGTKVQVPVMMFYVQRGGRRILVDTGCSDPESAAKYHYPLCASPRRTRPGRSPRWACTFRDRYGGSHPSALGPLL